MAVNYLGQFIIWSAVNLIAIIITYASFTKIRVSNLRWWPSWIDLSEDELGYYFQVKFDQKTVSTRVIEYTHIANLMAISFSYGNMGPRIMGPTDLTYLALLLVTIPIYGVIQQIKQLDHFSFTYQCLTNLTPRDKMCLSVLFTCLGGLFGYHLYLAYVEGILVVYCIACVAIVLFYAGLYRYWLQSNGQQGHWHIHHWFFGWFWSMCFRFNTPVSKASCAIMYAVFIQGAIAFNVEPIIY